MHVHVGLSVCRQCGPLSVSLCLHVCVWGDYEYAYMGVLNEALGPVCVRVSMCVFTHTHVFFSMEIPLVKPPLLVWIY